MDVEFFFNDGNKDENRKRNPDLGVDGIRCRAIEGLDAEMLLDPLEEQFNLPARSIEFCNQSCIERKLFVRKTNVRFLSMSKNLMRRRASGYPSSERLITR